MKRQKLGPDGLKEILGSWVARRAGSTWVYSGETRFTSKIADLPPGFVSVVKTGGVEGRWGDAGGSLTEEYILSDKQREPHSWLTLEIILRELYSDKAQEVIDLLRQNKTKYNERPSEDFDGNCPIYEVAIISFEQIGEVLGNEIGRDPKAWLKGLLNSKNRELRILGSRLGAEISIKAAKSPRA